MTQRILKIFLVFIIVLSFSITCVYASGINLDLPSEDGNAQIDNNTQLDNTQQEENNIESPVNDGNQEILDENSNDNTVFPSDTETLQPSTVTSAPDSGLSATNIINILLITVGVIIILLAIAIIIRLK